MVVALLALALGALSATASAAAPVFFGKAAVGSKVEPVSFSGTLGAAFLEGKSGTKITCKAGTTDGEVTGPTTGKNGVTKFTGCETAGLPCENAKAGEIDTKVLAGTLGNVTATTPGIRLFDEKEGKGGKLAEIHLRRRLRRRRGEGFGDRLALWGVRQKRQKKANSRRRSN